MTAPLLRREFAAELHVRAAGDPSERIIEGVVIPFGQVADVRDTADGPRYRETIGRGALEGLDPARVTLEALVSPGRAWNTHEGSTLVGRGIGATVTDEGLAMQMRVARTAAGDELLELAREGVLTDLSASFRPVEQRTRPDGVIERTKIDLRRVAVVERGAYPGAQVTAVRAAQEDHMPDKTQAAAPAEDTDEETATETPPTTSTADDKRPNRTRVQVDVERRAERAAIERETVADLGRSAPDGPRSQALVTRAEAIYGPRSDHSFLRDGWLASRGDYEARERQDRHELHMVDVSREIERAGDVLSSEIPGAYPNDYLPGLLTPRILKGRPMGGFYDRVPIADARPRIFAKVTTSTTVAVQSAEGANPAASDFATTAVTVTPLLYGAETVVSRQVLDGADPSALQMVLSDMIEAYAQASETVIKTAVEAGASASGAAIVAATPYAGLIANLVAYQAARFNPAEGQFIPPALYTVALAQADSTGRNLLAPIGPLNSMGAIKRGGAGFGLLDAEDYLSWASTVNVVVTGRPSDYAIFESSVASFSYDAVTGPAGVRIGIWAYLVVGTRLGSLKVTAA